MSLINQMLRDLEERRQVENRQQSGGEPAPVVTSSAGFRRHLLLLLGGVLLAVVIWGGSEFLRQKQEDVPGVGPLFVVEQRSSVEKVLPVSKQEPKSVPVPVQPKSEPVVIVAVEAEKASVAPSPSPAPEPPAVEKKNENVSLPQKETPVVAESTSTNVEDARFRKKTAPLSPEERAQALYLQSLSVLQQGDDVVAENNLLQALELNPNHQAARLQLINLLRQNNRVAEAFSQVEMGLQLHPQSHMLRKDMARQLLSAGRLDEAIATLNYTPFPAMAQDLEYHALLAALLQESGDYQHAIPIYRGLLSYQPQESMWWLGLAISLDQSGDAEQAKSAYLKVAGQQGLRADLADYVASRLQAL
ncbi:MSHA biogenesis protein MshN [Malonomonas rubra DSM 5091]|uniref:MSHA biogenesis protein MshN n=1 Tax=Malonomonas rubra DSM 5091 TaxID=1122189 RepID=A0A1M6M5U0_MALRU|nr:tetratricopeptide repeat protein [Malonomonas rubra]SHJ78846.1 MSHA biogenesis protein MshN [Malonomonas rubra DSM 5091]